MSPFLQSLCLGFSIAAPVGPIGLLCLRRSLAAGRLAGLVSGLGAATADAVYGMIAALGLAALTSVLVEYRGLLQLGGGLFIVYLGVATVRADVSLDGVEPVRKSTLSSAYLSALALTLANPMTILSFVGLFAGLGTAAAGATVWAGVTLVSGVFLGSAAWWLLLSFTAAALRDRIRVRTLRAINVASGLLLAALGVLQLVRLA